MLKKASLLASTFLFGISSVYAAERLTSGTPAVIGIDNGLLPFVDNDTIKLGGPHTIVAPPAGASIINGIDLDGYTGILSTQRAINLGSVINPGVGGGLSLVFNAASDVTLTGAGTNDYSGLKNVDFNNNNNKLIINSSNLNIATAFKSTGGDNGSISVKSTGTTFSGSFDANAGSKVKNLAIAKNIASTTLDTDLNLSGDLTIDQGSRFTVKTGRTINAANIRFTRDSFGAENGDKIIFEHNTTVNAPISLDFGVLKADVEIQGGINIKGDLGTDSRRLGKVDFASTDSKHIISLNGSIHARELSIDAATLKVNANVVDIDADYTSNNTTYDLGKNTLRFHGNAKQFTNTNFSGDLTFNTTFDGTTGGHLAAKGMELDMSGANSITINLTDTSSVPNAAGRKFTVFAELLDLESFGEGGAVTSSGTVTLLDNAAVTLILTEDRPLVEWTHDKGVLCQKLVSNPSAVVLNLVADQENALIVLGSPAANDLLNAVNNGNGNQVLNGLQPAIALGSVPGAESVETASQMISGDVKTQTNKIGARLQQTIGVSTGDGAQSHGAWLAPIYGVARQESRSQNPGYLSRYYGGMIGVDTLINDDTTIGAAVSVLHHYIIHKDSNQGDKTNMDTVSLLLYGSKNISDKFFVNGVASVGSTTIDNKEIRRTFPNASIASAKYKTGSFSAEITGGYKYNIAEYATITPLAGFEVTRLGEVNYEENGSGNQDLTVKRKVYTKGELIGGVKLNKSFEYSDFTLIPEIHGFIRHDILNEKFKIKARFKSNQQCALVARTAKQNQTTFLIGGGGDIRKENFEYGFSYDFRFAKKYKAHQGVLTLRTEF
jgi:outer membrane autotransporter protein